jgi:hypothetical protein
MKSKQKIERQVQEHDQALVRHVKEDRQGMIIKKSKHHEGFFIVLCEGSLEEWHISNIDGL